MTTPDDKLAQLHETVEALEEAERARTKLIAVRDRLIRQSRRDGATISNIAQATGLSTSQVNNILGNRKTNKEEA